MADKILKWRDSDSIKGVRNRLKIAVKACTDGSSVKLELKSAQNLIEICNQLIHIEENHEEPT